MRGMRHGYGIRKSAPFGKASKYRANKALRASLTSLRSNEGQSGANPEPTDKRDRRVDDSRGGFVLQKSSAEPTVRRRSLGSGNIKKGIFTGLMIRKQRSTGDLGSGSIRSTGSSASWVSTDSAQSAMTNASIPSDSNASFVIEDETMDPSVTETYMGEWKNDKRSGYGISERSDGLRYEGEWYANKKYGYGVTTFSNGEKEEGKYKNNVLITSQKKKLFLMRSAKFRERIDAAVNAAQRASKIALQKSDIAINRTATARGKAEQADIAAAHAREDSDIAESVAKQYAPDFRQPGLGRLKDANRNKYAEMQRHNQNIVEINLEKNANPNPDSTNLGQNPIENAIPNHNIPNNIASKPLNPNIPNQTPYSQIHNNPTYNTPYNPTYQQGEKLPLNNPSYGNPTTNNPYNNPIMQQQMNDIGPKLPQNIKENNPGNEYSPALNRHRSSLPTAENTNNPHRRASRPYLKTIGPQSSKGYDDQYTRPPSRNTSVD
ncbi:hypothetical protein NQ314_020904, partial [Rhamnusium bicolor]